MEFPNPLLEIPLKEEGGEIIIPGNRALINLNLSSKCLCCEARYKNICKVITKIKHLRVALKTKIVTKSFLNLRPL